MKDIINWQPTPQASNDMAAVGEIFDGLLRPQVWWNNPKSYFEASIVGRNGLKQVPGQFDRLQDAKEACEKFALGMVLGATDNTSKSQILIKVIGPGNVGKMEVLDLDTDPLSRLQSISATLVMGMVREIYSNYNDAGVINNGND